MHYNKPLKLYVFVQLQVYEKYTNMYVQKM